MLHKTHPHVCLHRAKTDLGLVLARILSREAFYVKGSLVRSIILKFNKEVNRHNFLGYVIRLLLTFETNFLQVQLIHTIIFYAIR